MVAMRTQVRPGLQRKRSLTQSLQHFLTATMLHSSSLRANTHVASPTGEHAVTKGLAQQRAAARFHPMAMCHNASPRRTEPRSNAGASPRWMDPRSNARASLRRMEPRRKATASLRRMEPRKAASKDERPASNLPNLKPSPDYLPPMPQYFWPEYYVL